MAQKGIYKLICGEEKRLLNNPLPGEKAEELLQAIRTYKKFLEDHEGVNSADVPPVETIPLEAEMKQVLRDHFNNDDNKARYERIGHLAMMGIIICYRCEYITSDDELVCKKCGNKLKSIAIKAQSKMTTNR